VQYAVQETGCTDKDLMSRALDDCFGCGEPIGYDNVLTCKDVIVRIYDDLEIKSISQTFDGALKITETAYHNQT